MNYRIKVKMKVVVHWHCGYCSDPSEKMRYERRAVAMLYSLPVDVDTTDKVKVERYAKERLEEWVPYGWCGCGEKRIVLSVRVMGDPSVSDRWRRR